MGHRLRELRQARGWSFKAAGDAFGMSESGYKKIERGERGLKLPVIKKACAVYGVEEQEVIGDAPYDCDAPPLVPVVGFVGAGSEAHFYADSDGDIGETHPPPIAGFSGVAVMIRGSSLGRKWNGALAFYEDRREPPTPDLIGRLCVVGLSDGRVLIKWIERGREDGRYDLESETEETIRDAEVIWAARVTDIRPK